jgi:SPP1 gp7 family putative phage head morphogenesis protein
MSTLDAQFSTVVLYMQKRGLGARAGANALLDQWGAPQDLEKSKKGTKGVGDHGIPEIGRQEQAFYAALTDGQRDAYNALKEMVYYLFRRGKSFDVIDPWTVDEPIEAWKRRAFQMLLGEPMKAFMLGQILAREFLEGAAIARALGPTDLEAIRYLQAYSFSEIGAKFDELKGSMREVLIQGIHEGANPKEVARRMADVLNHDYSTDFERIAITETARAESQGRLQECLDSGETHVVGSSAHDERTCPDCLRLINEKTYPISEVIGKSNYGRKRKEYLPVIPLHPRCRCVWLPAPS